MSLKVILLLSAVPVMNASLIAVADVSSGTDCEYRIQGDQFQLTVSQTFPRGVTLEEAKRAYASDTLGAEVSDLVTRIERIRRPDGIVEVRTTGRKFGISMTTSQLCRIEEDENSFKQFCDFDQSNSANRRLFVGGRGTNNLDCEKDATGIITCTTYAEGRQRPINIIVRKWTAQELAASSADESLSQLGSFYFFVAQEKRSGQEARAAYDKSSLAQLVERLVGDAYHYSPRGKSSTTFFRRLIRRLRSQRLNRSANDKMLIIRTSDRTGAYSVQNL